MAGTIDVYQNCPCGSGKKLKFCCHAILAEMSKAAEMQRHHQYQAALTTLEALERRNLKEVWSRAWVRTTMSMLHASLAHREEARRLVELVLEELPEHPLAVVLYAVDELTTAGYPAARRAVYDALQTPNASGDLLANLWRLLAVVMGSQGHLLAVRECLIRALLSAENKDEFGEAFMAFEANGKIPYPVRSNYQLRPFAGEEAQLPQYDEAMRLATAGCFSDAAKAFGTIARQAPDQAWIWWNIAVCHAWAGEDPLATRAFKACASHETELERKADCLVLADLVRPPDEQTGIERISQEYRVGSIGRLLTLLDQQPRYVREEIGEEEAELPEVPTAWYQVLDRDPSGAGARSSLTDFPVIVGQIQVFDAGEPGTSQPKAVLGAYGREQLGRLCVDFEKAGAGLLERQGEPHVHSRVRAESVRLNEIRHFPHDLTPAQELTLGQERLRNLRDEVWPNVPLQLLDGKTPLEAAAMPDMAPALVAAIIEFDAKNEAQGTFVDTAVLRERLGLPPLAPLEIAADCDVRSLTALELRRLAFPRLTDEQLFIAANRLARLGHARLHEESLKEALARPSIRERPDLAAIYHALFQCAVRRFDDAQGLEWMALARQHAKEQHMPLERLLDWELEELSVRIRHPEDPAVGELAATLWNYYRPKLPEAGEAIAAVLNELKLSGPWNSGTLAGAGEAMAGAATGLWTPEAAAGTAPSKLWLPGQQ